MHIDPTEKTPEELYFLLTSLVVPRPIAWVSSVDTEGRPNLAPHSYFNAVASAPPIVMFVSTHSSPHHAEGFKDTLRNVEATGQFVVNVVGRAVMKAMNVTATDSPPGVDEFALAGLDAAPSKLVRPPRVRDAKVAMECAVRQILPMGNATVVFGEVLWFHLDEDIVVDGRVDPLRWNPVGRLSGSDYSVVERIEKMRRPAYADLTANKGGKSAAE